MFSGDMDDMLNAIFNGGGLGGFNNAMSGNIISGGNRRQQRNRRGQDVGHALPVTLEDLYSGKKFTIQRTRSVLCPECKGSGMKGKKPRQSCICQLCRGSGSRVIVRQMGMMVQQIQTICEACGGSGESISARDRCTHCNGQKTVEVRHAIEVNVERGMSDEQKIVLERMADESPNEDIPGDLVVVLQESKHNYFKRKDNDLYIHHRISLEEALCGFQLKFTHLDGRELFVRRNRGEITTPGSVYYVQGEGMPIFHQRNKFGNLVVEFEVQYPSKLNRQEIKLVKLALPPLIDSNNLSSLDCNVTGESNNLDVIPNANTQQKVSSTNRNNNETSKYDEDDSTNSDINDSLENSIAQRDEEDSELRDGEDDNNVVTRYIVKEDINALRSEIAKEQETDDADDIPTVACAHQERKKQQQHVKTKF